MAIIVSIRINDREILEYHAVRTLGGSMPDDINEYETGQGNRLTHRYGDGASKLVSKILEVDSEAKENARQFKIFMEEIER